MPIRSDRGRNAVSRAFWTWPLRSWRHFAVVAAGAVVATASVATAVGSTDRAEPDSRASSVSVPPQTSSTTTWAINPTTRPQPPTSAAPSSTSTAPTSSRTERWSTRAVGPVESATEFVKRWVRPHVGIDAATWRERLMPYVVPEARVDLASIDPRNIPATKLTGKPKLASRGETVAAVRVPTDAGPVKVSLLRQTAGRWLVSEWGAEER